MKQIKGMSRLMRACRLPSLAVPSALGKWQQAHSCILKIDWKGASYVNLASSLKAPRRKDMLNEFGSCSQIELQYMQHIFAAGFEASKRSRTSEDKVHSRPPALSLQHVFRSFLVQFPLKSHQHDRLHALCLGKNRVSCPTKQGQAFNSLLRMATQDPAAVSIAAHPLGSAPQRIRPLTSNAIVWRIRQRLIVRTICPFPVSCLLISISQVIPGCHIARLELHCLSVIINGHCCLLHVEVGKSQCIMHLRTPGLGLLSMLSKDAHANGTSLALSWCAKQTAGAQAFQTCVFEILCSATCASSSGSPSQDFFAFSRFFTACVKSFFRSKMTPSSKKSCKASKGTLWACHGIWKPSSSPIFLSESFPSLALPWQRPVLALTSIRCVKGTSA